MNKLSITMIMLQNATSKYDNLIEEFIAFMPYRFYVDGIIQMKARRYFNG